MRALYFKPMSRISHQLKKKSFFTNIAVESPNLIINREKNVTVITFNRPKALNAIGVDMGVAMTRELKAYENKNLPYPGALILKGAGGKAFCAGGDIKSICEIVTMDEYSRTGNPKNIAGHTMRKMFHMLSLFARLPIPIISFWDGIVMGAGVGISVFGKFRIATENSLLAMPEAGLFPDAGSSGWMPRLKSGFGNYIGLTGGHLKAADLIYAGIATHYVPSSKLQDLEKDIIDAAVADPVASGIAISDVLSKYNVSPSEEFLSQSVLKTNEELIRRVFSNPDSVETVISSLKSESAGNDFALKTLKTLSKLSPTSLKIILESLRQGQNYTVKESFEKEYRIMVRALGMPNFQEGIRAVLVDKDNKPKWNPSSLEEVSKEDIQQYFEPLGEHELYITKSELDIL